MINRLIASIIFLLTIVSCGQKNKPTVDTNPKDSLSTSMNLINEQIKNDPDNPNLLYERSKMFYNQKLIDKASEDINKAISIDSSKAIYFLHQSDVFYAMNKIAEAKKAIQKSLQLDPKSKDANAKMGELQYYLKDYQNAFKYLDEALRIDPYFLSKGYVLKKMMTWNWPSPALEPVLSRTRNIFMPICN